MPRSRRVAPGGYVYHVLNRGVGRRRLFYKPRDYEAFEEIVEETQLTRPMRICGFCLMPNHWHLVLSPEHDGELAAFMQRLTITHVTRWQKHRGKVGEGHLYQGRFKSFPVEENDYFYQVMRYVERNALRAELVDRAEAWRWGSLWRRLHGSPEQRAILGPWPVAKPRQWPQLVNEPQHETEVSRYVSASCEANRLAVILGWLLRRISSAYNTRSATEDDQPSRRKQSQTVSDITDSFIWTCPL